LISEAQVRHVRPDPSNHRKGVFPLSNPEPAPLVPLPAPATTAERLGTASWSRGRLALGVLLVLVAVLGGALYLQRAQHLQPVYVASRDLPTGTVLTDRDLAVAQVRLPAAELRHYLRPRRAAAATGRLLTTAVPKDALVPAAALTTPTAADMVELPVTADPGDMAQGLRPGDRVQVLAAYAEGPRRGQAVALLPSAEVVRVLHDQGAIGGPDRETGVQVRLPSGRAPLVTGAIASARIFIVKAPPLATANPTSPATPGDTQPTSPSTPTPTPG
jgi:SAF domain